jgi:tryptophan 2,3-dioxygenase
LLGLQVQRTTFPDELIFIIYHQNTELYFKMILSEMKQIADDTALTAEMFTKRLKRINRYMDILIESFDVMSEGMDPAQFQKFRMTLTPASGFQSAQFRQIELAATDLIQIVNKDVREKYMGASLQEQFDHIYWREGATEIATGAKTLTLRQFEDKYHAMLLQHLEYYEDKNLKRRFEALPESEQTSDLKNALKAFDFSVNVRWPLTHFRSAAKYLYRDPDTVAATGGTNWRKYLPPKFQRRIFYPALWTEQEIEEWGIRPV